MVKSELNRILNDGWRIVPMGPLPAHWHAGRNVTLWQVVDHDDKPYGSPVGKQKALIELRKQWRQWKALQK